MATGNRRDVTLGVNVETAGERGLRALADEMRQLGAAGEGLPADFQQTAAALDRLADETEQAAAAARQHRETERQARAEVAQQRRSLDEKRDALARLRAESTTATRATVEYQQAERGMRLAVIDARAALRDKQAALGTASAAARTAVAEEQRLAAESQRVVTAYRQQAQQATQTAAQSVAAHGTMRDSLRGVADQLRTIQSLALTAVGGGLLGGMVGDVARTADEFANLHARVALVTGEGAALTQALTGVFEVAQRTGTSVDAVGQLFVRTANAVKGFGINTSEALAFTEDFTRALILSGASAQEAQSATLQLSQALASGRVQGEELRAILENGGRAARALADGLGVTVGELRDLGAQGKLTTEAVFQAIRGQSAVIQAEFDQMPKTIGRAMTALSNEWVRYVGEVDRANGASAAAASALTALAENLDTVAGFLYGAGKAAAAWQALKLAQSFLERATAARAAAAAIATETAALAANTAATNANAAAKRVAAGAAETAAASTGRFSAILGTVKGFALVTVLTNLREIGTAIGEGAAKLAGYGKRLEEAERAMRADAEAARANAAAKAQLAQQMQLAQDKALGLTTEAKKLAATFDEVRAKGGSATDALEKLSKAMDLSDISGITAAGAALDALAQRGELAAHNIRDAWGAALKDVDLGTFEASARAAFDSSEQGARRLQAALDAIADEALRRAGTSVEELQTGFNAAMTSALNDVDALDAALRDLEATGDEAGAALARSLDRALDTAKTEQAVQAVIDRWEDLGEQGRVTGDMLADGLERARKRLDEIRPGITSVEEAFRQLGVRGPAELARIAAASREAWEMIRRDGTLALSIKQEAFKRYAEAAIAANDGVITSELRVQAEMLGLAVAADGAGKAIIVSMDEAGRSLDRLHRKVKDVATGLSGIDMRQPEFTEWDRNQNLGDATPESWAQVGGVLPPGWRYKVSGRPDLGIERIPEMGELGGGQVTRSAPGAPPPPAFTKEVRVTLDVAGKQSTLYGTQADADALVSALESAKRTSGM